METATILIGAVLTYAATRLFVDWIWARAANALGGSATLILPLLTSVNVVIMLLAVHVVLSLFGRDTFASAMGLLLACCWLGLRVIDVGVYGWYLPRFHGLVLPSAVRHLSTGLVVVVALGWGLHAWGGLAVFDITAIAVGIAIVFIVVLHSVIRDFIVGMTIWLQQAVQVGAHVRIGDFEGEVSSVDWKRTRLRLADGDIVSIPNQVLVGAPITTYQGAVGTRRVKVRVDIGDHIPPNAVSDALLAVARDIDGVLASPPATVVFEGARRGVSSYWLNVWIADPKDRGRITSGINAHLWYRLRRQGYVEGAPPLYTRDDIEDALRLVPFFSVLEDSLFARLAASVRFARYGRGEILFRQGEAGHSLFVIWRGRLDVLIAGERGLIEVIEVPAGDFVGERSLLTGEPRSATVRASTDCDLLEVSKSNLAEVMAASPLVAEQISTIMVRRDLHRNNILSTTLTRVTTPETMLSRIRAFFALS